jgi:hypothetical protein
MYAASFAFLESSDHVYPVFEWESVYNVSTMIKHQAFQAVACEGGFVAVQESEDGSVLWLRKGTAEAEDRICIDSSTNSATAYSATIPWKINSKIFREASTLRLWILSRPVVEARS